MAGKSEASRDGTEFPDEARLADARFAAHADRRSGFRFHRRLDQTCQLAQFRLPADESVPRARRGEQLADAPHRHGIREPLKQGFADRLSPCDVRHRLVHGFRNQGLAGLGSRAQPRRKIDRVPGDRIFRLRAAGDDRGDNFAAGDADMQLQRLIGDVRHPGRGSVHFQCRARGAFAVVVVSDGGAESGQYPITRMIYYMAPVVFDDAVHHIVKPAEQHLHPLRVHAGTERGIARNVGKQDGGLSALAFRRRILMAGWRTHGMRLHRCRQCDGSRMGALGTESGGFGECTAAVGANPPKRRSAVLAEFCALSAIVLAAGAFHVLPDRS